MVIAVQERSSSRVETAAAPASVPAREARRHPAGGAPAALPALSAGDAGEALLVPAHAGPLALLRTLDGAVPGTAVYVITDPEVGDGDPTVTATVMIARGLGLVVLDAAGVRRLGLPRRHPAVALVAPPDRRGAPIVLDPPPPPGAGPALAVEAPVAAGASGDPAPPEAPAGAPPLTAAFLVASRNGESTIADTVRSAVCQGPVYVVSDGSTDATAEVARAEGAEVLALEQNVGKPTALRRAVEHFDLCNRYGALAILDDDTIVDPDFLAHCRRRLEPGVAIAVGRTCTRWGDDRRWNVWLGSRAYAYWRYQATLRRAQSALNVMNCISGSNSVYRTGLLAEVLVEQTPYIVDDTYWTLETHRRGLGRIVYVPEARAHICDPTNLRDWYRQNLRWLWGSLQGVWGHGIGRRATLLDFSYLLLIFDWIVYVVVGPVLAVTAVTMGWVPIWVLLAITLLGYGAGACLAAAVLRKWRLALMTPALILIDWLYRAVFVHAFVRTLRQPRVASCRWDSPARYS